MRIFAILKKIDYALASLSHFMENDAKKTAFTKNPLKSVI
jgi:hypothetical protein